MKSHFQLIKAIRVLDIFVTGLGETLSKVGSRIPTASVLKGVEASRDQLEEVSQALDHWAVEIEECNSFEKSIDLVVLKKLPRAMRRKIIVRWLRSSASFPTKTLNEVLDGLERGLSLKANLSPESSLSLNEKSIDIICSLSSLRQPGQLMHFHLWKMEFPKRKP